MKIASPTRFITIVALGALAVASAACGSDQAASTKTSPAVVVSPDASAPALAFSAGGAIYTIDATGAPPAMLVLGVRSHAWSASPAFSRDGRSVLFTRDYDMWSAKADGSDAHLLADVADVMTPPANAASNFSLGAEEIAWSPDGSRVAYLRARIGGSGVSDVWTMRPDGSDRRNLYTSGDFASLAWLDASRVALKESDHIVVLQADGSRDADIALPPDARSGQRAIPASDGRWLIGSTVDEGPIMFGPLDHLSHVADGISPTLSPDGHWIAYFSDESLRLVNIDGTHDRPVADLSLLGGRDRHFAEQPGCAPEIVANACSYRPPSVAWLPGADAGALAAAPTAVPAPLSPPRLDATPLVEVTGLFTEPRETKIDAYRSLGPKPTPFAPWDQKSTMLYDIGAGTETNLGPGTLGRFSPDSTRMVWIADPQPPFGAGEAWMIDMASGQKRDVGPGRLVNFIDDDHIAIAYPAGNDSYVLDLRTGERTDRPNLTGTFPDFSRSLTPDGYVIDLASSNQDFTRTFSLLDETSRRVLLTVTAQNVVPAGHGSLLVAVTSPTDATQRAAGFTAGPINLFLVEIATGRATFVATTTPDAAYAADDGYVVWTDGSCSPSPGTTRVLRRSDSAISQLDASLVPTLMPRGLILSGEFGGSALIDPVTLEYRTVIPARGDSSWSSDYRYASLGQFGGHDGCSA